MDSSQTGTLATRRGSHSSRGSSGDGAQQRLDQGRPIRRVRPPKCATLWRFTTSHCGTRGRQKRPALRSSGFCLADAAVRCASSPFAAFDAAHRAAVDAAEEARAASEAGSAADGTGAADETGAAAGDMTGAADETGAAVETAADDGSSIDSPLEHVGDWVVRGSNYTTLPLRARSTSPAGSLI